MLVFFNVLDFTWMKIQNLQERRLCSIFFQDRRLCYIIFQTRRFYITEKVPMMFMFTWHSHIVLFTWCPHSYFIVHHNCSPKLFPDHSWCILHAALVGVSSPWHEKICNRIFNRDPFSNFSFTAWRNSPRIVLYTHGVLH